MSLFKMGFSGMVIIFFIIIMRSLVIHKLPKRALLTFWDLALFRLLVPFYVPVWISGLFPFKWPRINLPGNEAGIDPGIEMIDVGTFGDGVDLAKRSADAFVMRHLLLPLPDTFVIRFNLWHAVWFIGSVLITGFFVFAYIRWHREFRESIPVHNEYVDKWILDHKLKRHLEIRYSDKVSAPLSYGVFKPVILMPKCTDWSDCENLKFVLAHEFVHIRYFDAVMKFALIAAVCVHWFNPFVWIMYVLANRDIELACDESVIRMFGENTRKSYAMMLVKMEEAKNVFAPVANNFNKNAIEIRINMIIRKNRISKRVLGWTSALMICIMTMLSIVVKAEPGATVSEYFRFPLSEIASDHVTRRLRAEGIDTDSNQYKAVIKLMTDGLDEENMSKATTTNIGIKRLMQDYDDDGDYMVNGIAGLLITDENIDSKNRIIPIPESSREEMFEQMKAAFIRENGMTYGDAEKRSDVYFNMYPKIVKEDRLAAGHTLGEYERFYFNTMVRTVLAIDPEWKSGDDIPEGALDKLSREDIESSIISNGTNFQYINEFPNLSKYY